MSNADAFFAFAVYNLESNTYTVLPNKGFISSMHITRIELENIKSHEDSKFEFSRGSIAVTGPNGAGKTTLIEAVAWTLFDVLDYRKDDFVRRGAKKGIAKVTFESGLDERQYTVIRDTGTGYHIYDPELKVRIADKKEEVTRFLWKHLGVEPGTDLSSLFRQAIGVPQGTLTAIFLATAADRKRTFDALLKVEEYRRGADELLKTQRVIESRVAEANVKIARVEGSLGRADDVEKELRDADAELKELKKERDLSQKLVDETTVEISQYDERKRHLDEAVKQLDAARNTNERAERELTQRLAEFKESEAAVAELADLKQDADKHQEAIGKLKELESERRTRDGYRSELQKAETELAKISADENRVRSKLTEIENSRAEIEKLTPLTVEQAVHEKRRDELRTLIAAANAAAKQASELETRLTKLRLDFKANKDLLTRFAEANKDVEPVAELQDRERELVTELAKLKAELERDERFQAEISNGLCPILSEKCLNLKPGQTLESFVTSKFSEVRERISVVESEHSGIGKRLAASQNVERESTRMASLAERNAEIEAEGVRMRDELKELTDRSEEANKYETEVAETETRLKELGDPRGRIVLLEREISRETEIKSELVQINENRKTLDAEKASLSEKLTAFSDLDKVWTDAANVRDETAEKYRRSLVLESAAAKIDERRKSADTARSEKEAADASFNTADKVAAQRTADYDEQKHRETRERLDDSKSRLTAVTVRTDAAEKRRTELETELKKLEEIRRSLAGELAEKEKLEKAQTLTVFVRDTLKDAAPLVARNYVQHVSVEANNLFREISGDAERTLKWAEDYAILLEEGGHERPFQSLSGGEQMAAAMSVRLALLKQLSDIRIAFFDEPTTNMDAERRENLAQQIGAIGHFEQLFVISHDDTFEGYMDHEISVGE